MKTLFVFFLFLCFHLFGAGNLVHAKTVSPASFLTTSGFKKIHSIQAGKQNYTVVKNNDLEEEDIDLVTVEDDEDITRKLISLSRYFAAFCCYLFILSYVGSSISNYLSFYQPSYISSRKYILQRVLRI